MKFTSLRAHLSYEDFVTLLEETREIHREDYGRGLDSRRFEPLVDDVPQSNESFETIRTDVPPSNEPSIPQSNVYCSNEPMLTNVPQSNKPFETIPNDVPLSNELCIPQSNSYLSNEPMLINISLSNEPMLTNVPLSIEPKPIIGQTNPSEIEQVKDLVDFLFKSAAYTKDLYDFSKEFNIGIPKKTWSNLYILMSRYGVAYTNHAESWNNVIVKVRDLPICSEMSYMYRVEAEMSQARLTSWAMDHCESKKFMMTSYGRTDSVNIEDGTCFCRWWQTMGIPCEHGVRTLGLVNVDPTARVSEYFSNDTYKAVYKSIWIPIRGIK
ncbi:hypothetical protein GIB67_007406 [Kingdonia uniflora]|uniref:SWIM-type domain-containing protein n=1 Tax=Kingdonia uniflora TaxID=39325 RepID=A0A7J7MLH8_9MAGN|nr:hypothetical protein GIB67_007406 [Kingdonia uniflora]